MTAHEEGSGPDEHGVPTSYSTAVQLVCRPSTVDDPQGKADVLAAQFADFQSEGGHAEVSRGSEPYGRMLLGEWRTRPQHP